MGFNIFLDANVVLDQMLKRKDYENTRKVFQLIINGEILAYTSPSIIHILGYWLGKIYDKHETRQRLLILLNDVRVLALDHQITLQALHSTIIDVEDALQYHTALYHSMDYFVSIDKRLKTLESLALPVLTPTELVKLLK